MKAAVATTAAADPAHIEAAGMLHHRRPPGLKADRGVQPSRSAFVLR